MGLLHRWGPPESLKYRRSMPQHWFMRPGSRPVLPGCLAIVLWCSEALRRPPSLHKSKKPFFTSGVVFYRLSLANLHLMQLICSVLLQSSLFSEIDKPKFTFPDHLSLTIRQKVHFTDQLDRCFPLYTRPE